MVKPGSEAKPALRSWQPVLRELLEAYNVLLFQTFNDDPELIKALGTLMSGPFEAQRHDLREKVIDAFAVLLQPHLLRLQLAYLTSDIQ